MVRMIRFVPAALAFGLLAGLAAAGPMPAFGPQGFELTAGEIESFTETFAVEAAGPYVLYLHNGDVESSRVEGASVTLNGVGVVDATEVTVDVPGLVRQIDLLEGDNEVTVEISGQAGAFVTLAIGRPGPKPVFVAGRLLLPWGREDGERLLALALRNGSPRFPRAIRIVFFRPDGSVAAASERFALPPRGSTSLPVGALIDPADWDAGSVAVFYTGPGTARLFGSARQVDLPPGFFSEILPLEHAGLLIARPHHGDPPDHRERPSRR